MKNQYVIVCENKNEYDIIKEWLKEFDDAIFLYDAQPDIQKYDGIIAVFENEPKESCESINKWVGHSHLVCVWGKTNSEKKQRFTEVVCHTLGIPAPLETERKFLIKMPDIPYLNSLANCRPVDIRQSYLDIPGKNVRIRERNNIYIRTEKSKLTEITRTEVESLISEQEYNELAKHRHKHLAEICKTRYCLLYGGKYFEIDVFPFWQNAAYLEIELINEDENFAIPPFIEIIKEVTFDKEYTNKSLAEKLNAGSVELLERV